MTLLQSETWHCYFKETLFYQAVCCLVKFSVTSITERITHSQLASPTKTLQNIMQNTDCHVYEGVGAEAKLNP